MKHRIATTSAVVLIAAALAGCGGEGQSSDTTEIVWWKLAENSETANEVIADLVEKFEAENPDIRVSVEQRSGDPHQDALRTVAGTDGAPDIFFMWTGLGQVGDIVDAGASLDLTSYYKELGWDEGMFSDSTLDTITQYGGHHGVPWQARAQGLFYNNMLFKQAGIDSPPETFDELIEDSKALLDAGITPFAFGGTVNWHVMRLLDNIMEATCGPETFDALRQLEANWSAEACVTESFDLLTEFAGNYLNKGFISISNTEAFGELFAGNAAMGIEGDPFNQLLRDNGQNEDDWRVVSFPGVDRLYGFTTANYISATSEHPDEAMRFLEFLASEDPQRRITEVLGSRSVNLDALPEGDRSDLDKSWDTIIDEATGIFINSDQALPLNITTELWRVQNAVITGELQPSQAGAEMQRFIDGL
ncbi:ABC transporter substrate-binding protein [Saccharomonospora sp. NPDC046836]|uniref:ABC transporter substrate-binding protein n=1 Tax=Saccharomonospora sp. NPDC046836 TaxID=3156921 RepID=UPI0033E3363D